MRFFLGELEVYFPYSKIYPEQYAYMNHLKQALDVGIGKKRHCLLEMPTGTGKTVCLLSLITSYQASHSNKVGKLIYCTRTVPEMTKCIEEMKLVINYRRAQDANQCANTIGLCLSSRKNMCIHPRVSLEIDGDSVDAACRSLTAPWARKNKTRPTDPGGRGDADTCCSFFENICRTETDYLLDSGVYTLENLRTVGKEKGLCPYFMARQTVASANVLVFNYQYLLDPKVSTIVSKELAKDSIVVFDEAHNIDSICTEALSVYLDKRRLKVASKNIKKLKDRIKEVKETDTKRLNEEYNRLVEGLSTRSSTDSYEFSQGYVEEIAVPGNPVGGNPIPAVLPNDIIKESMPPAIRRADLFLNFLSSIINYFRRRIRSTKSVVKETPAKCFHHLNEKTGISKKYLKFSHARLKSLLHTLKITNLREFNPLTLVADFVTILATFDQGFVCIIEPRDTKIENSDCILQLSCLDASIAMKHVFDRFRSVIITSGTLSPLSFYPKVLGFDPVISRSFPMSSSRKVICPMVVTRGDDNNPISSAYNKRNDASVIFNYGKLLGGLCNSVPDGIVCFFTSYAFMENVILSWNEQGILQDIQRKKLIFIETKNVVETTIALQNFKCACDRGRGAVFLSIARDKVAEGIDFDRQYGRCVIMFGIPFQYTKSHSLESRLEFLRSEHNIQASEFLSFDALRQTSQCIGRVVRSKTDYGVVILADCRYNTKEKRDKLPPWVTSFLEKGYLNLSTSNAIHLSKNFLGQSSQPMSTLELNKSLLSESDIRSKDIDMPSISVRNLSGCFDWSNSVHDLTIEVARLD